MKKIKAFLPQHPQGDGAEDAEKTMRIYSPVLQNYKLYKLLPLFIT